MMISFTITLSSEKKASVLMQFSVKFHCRLVKDTTDSMQVVINNITGQKIFQRTTPCNRNRVDFSQSKFPADLHPNTAKIPLNVSSIRIRRVIFTEVLTRFCTVCTRIEKK